MQRRTLRRLTVYQCLALAVLLGGGLSPTPAGEILWQFDTGG